jgi:NAD(P)-dependent dehydrogenase (short-subunit alcohol dehydrogenase family)
MLTAGDMKGKAALVTGTSGELGKAVARKLAEAGANLCLVDADPAALASCAAELQALGIAAHVHATDLAVAENCRTAIEAAVSLLGRLDALCNVANVFIPSHTKDMPKADWDLTLAINLTAPFYLIQAALPRLLDTHGAIVNVTSCAAFMAQPYTAAYTATKAGMTQMTKALANEFIETPVRINCVAPGSLAVSSGNRAKIPSNVDMSRVLRRSPSRGLIDVDKIAAVIAFLASDASTGFHGTCITMDNGISLG